MKGAPRSKVFDDVYFSANDGLAETRHVFLDGNNLPEAWAGKERFFIGETGFGTGLNFLAVWKLLRETGGPKLHYISFEKYPLSAGEIAGMLSPWRNEFPEEMDALLAHYPLCVPGFHRIAFEDAVLTLVYDDVNEAMARVEAEVDCWFLDGFKPSANPDMWSETVFQQMARLSRPGASFATFTAAGFVKRGLQDAGFDVVKVKGFGAKRDMLTGRKT